MGAPLSYPFKPYGIITVTTAGTPVQISSTSQRAQSIFVAALKAKGTANSGANAYILDAAGNMLFVIPKGTTMEINTKKPGFADPVDISQLYVDVDTSGDGLLVTAQIP